MRRPTALEALEHENDADPLAPSDRRLDHREEHVPVVVGVQLAVDLEAKHPGRQSGHRLEHAVSPARSPVPPERAASAGSDPRSGVQAGAG
jgi:hypothetical protein